jgi:hypothetical protein
MLFFSWHPPGAHQVLWGERELLNQWKLAEITAPIYTDVRSAASIAFLSEFEPEFSIKPLDQLTENTQKGTVLINWIWLNSLHRQYGIAIPSWALDTHSSWQPVVKDVRGYEIYRLSSMLD